MAPSLRSKSKRKETCTDSDSKSKKIETLSNNRDNGIAIPDYEKQRLKTIQENKEKLEALGIKKMVNSLVGSVPKQEQKGSDKKGKGKGKMVDDEDEEYRPSDEEDVLGLSSEEDGHDEAGDDDDDFSLTKTKKKARDDVRTSKKQVSSKKPERYSDYVDDDEALMKAIALSLQDSTMFIKETNLTPKSSSAQTDPVQDERERNCQIQEDSGKRKRKKPISNRVQMKEDDLIIHFFQFDELGKGSITLRDLQRVAAVHDFTWSDKEMADMIYYFDSDGDGKLNLDDFCKIAGRCNMIQGQEAALT